MRQQQTFCNKKVRSFPHKEDFYQEGTSMKQQYEKLCGENIQNGK